MKKLEERDASVLTLRPLSSNDWPSIVKLFGDKGACGGCWCMSWRVPKHGRLWEESKGAKNRRALRMLVQRGDVHAVMAFDGDSPVGWCTYGPRESFPYIARVRGLAREDAEGVWSVVCFYLRAAWRRSGLGTCLLQQAARDAFRLGARQVEGFPAVPWDRNVPMPAAFAWTGVPQLFERSGFRHLRREEGLRPIFVRDAIEG
jgi:GNAT superfamily N-acetyltransferase